MLINQNKKTINLYIENRLHRCLKNKPNLFIYYDLGIKPKTNLL